MVKEKICYKVSIFKWNEKEPDVLTFYHMSEGEMNDWIENLLIDPFNNITHIVLEDFKVADYE